MNSDLTAHIQWFRNSASYINAHRGKTFVLAITGETIAHPNLENLIHDIALLQSLGIRIVLVHGARPQIEAQLHKEGIESHVINGHRITDLETLERVITATGLVRTQLESLFSKGLINSPMHGLNLRTVSGNFTTAQPLGVINGVDFHHTGVVRDINFQAIHAALDTGAIVIMSTLGYSPTGEVFNVTLDDLVAKTALSLKADKLLVFCHPIKPLRDTQSNNASVHPALLKTRLTSVDEHVALLTAAATSSLEGIPRVHILDHADDGALLAELFTRSGSGILVQKEEYESYRIATIQDVGGILELIRPLEQSGMLVTRSRELIEQEIHHFFVIEMDGMIIGCGALYPYMAEKMGEVACIAIHPEFRDKGRASALLDRIEEHAKGSGLSQLFVLSTQTSHWFVERGYSHASLELLPARKQSMYNMQRNSKVFIKPI